jgi:hypothetical protein
MQQIGKNEVPKKPVIYEIYMENRRIAGIGKLHEPGALSN